jgi:LysR family hydrogen peroxide-inducible transcriptional activator
MDLQQLRYVVALSQELNFVRAARRVHVTQPTLSQQLKKLEDELGLLLFERAAKGARLTPAGQKFLPYAVQVLDSLEKGVQELQQESGQIAGRVRFAAIPTIGPYVLPSVIPVLRKEAPQLFLEIYEKTTSDLLEAVRTGAIDLGLLSLPIDDAGLATRLVGEEEFLLAVSKTHVLAKKQSVSLKELEHEKLLILQEGHCFGNQALEFCKRSREDVQVIFEGSSLTSVMRLAAAGEGVTFVPRMAAESSAQTGLSFIPFSKPRPTRPIAFVWRISAPLTRAHRFLMEKIEEIYKSS